MDLVDIMALAPAPTVEDDAIDLPPGANSLDFLQAIYRDPRQPMLRRLKAAGLALPHEVPKLSVVATVDPDSDFAKRLELAIARSARIIEARAEPKVQAPPQVMDHRPAPSTVDRRYRR